MKRSEMEQWREFFGNQLRDELRHEPTSRHLLVLVLPVEDGSDFDILTDSNIDDEGLMDLLREVRQMHDPRTGGTVH